MSHTSDSYYLPEPSHWPLVGSVALFTTFGGFASMMHGGTSLWFYIGMALLAFMMFGWFSQVVNESESGKYNAQVDRSFRMGMMWFIFSEVMFFAAFFGALLYVRQWAGPWLAGEGNNAMTNELLWSGYEYVWPTNGPSEVGGSYQAMPAWGLPAINTLILLTSGLTVTWAHWGLKKENRKQLILGLFLTVVLGFLFVGLQAYEYGHAYSDLNLKLTTGIYGSTFYMLTGFHGLHVTIG
ncbi:MAG: cytochrome c oxidase subunit 3, partial [Gammaproteobacteria bacterium]|nr:cytochrome c oxidase subunit 3 [Gammaproteobacteria bacterium]